jgi:hypothetical protein
MRGAGPDLRRKYNPPFAIKRLKAYVKVDSCVNK